MELTNIGWDDFFKAGFADHEEAGRLPARVTREDRGMYALLSSIGELRGEVAGGFRHQAASKGDFPAVGDWVACQLLEGEKKAVIHGVLPRRSCFARKVAGGRTEEQVVAANVDTVFVVSGLDGGRNFSARRIERYLALCFDSGATPVVVLNKADLCDSVDDFVTETEAVAIGTPIEVVSAVTGRGLDTLRAYAKAGTTVALLGSSGVGKSALINAMMGMERQATGAVRADDLRGRHTTTRRELFFLPDGGMLIDTPGMREIQLWGNEESLEGAFPDIEELGEDCQYRDCRHMGENGCAVQQAVEEGTLDSGRYDSYLKLQKEMAYLARRQDQKSRHNPKAHWKELSKIQKKFKKDRKKP